MTYERLREDLRAKYLDQLLSSELEISGDLAEKARAEVITRVYRNDGGATIGVLQEHMAPALPSDREASTLEGAHHFCPSD